MRPPNARIAPEHRRGTGVSDDSSCLVGVAAAALRLERSARPSAADRCPVVDLCRRCSVAVAGDARTDEHSATDTSLDDLGGRRRVAARGRRSATRAVAGGIASRVVATSRVPPHRGCQWCGARGRRSRRSGLGHLAVVRLVPRSVGHGDHHRPRQPRAVNGSDALDQRRCDDAVLPRRRTGDQARDGTGSPGGAAGGDEKVDETARPATAPNGGAA